MANDAPLPGSIRWIDLTVEDAPRIRDFYGAVAGWRAEPVDMGGYSDFCMIPAGAGAPVAGVCHARGANAGLPACWLVYVTVADLEASVREAAARGGSVLAGPRSAGGGRYAVIRDPAGAACALYQP